MAQRYNYDQEYIQRTRKQRISARERQRRRRRKIIRRVIIIGAIIIAGTYFARPLVTDLITSRYESRQAGITSIFDGNSNIEDNPELEKFMKKYEKGNYKTGQEIKYAAEELEADFPQLMQWDARWGYDPYGSSVIGITGCAPTTMAMVIVGLNDDPTVNPRVLADYATQNGFYEEGSGTAWAFFAACANAYGIQCNEIALSESNILASVQSGQPVVCGMRPGHFTTSGHFIVIVGEEDGKLVIHDPNNVKNCEQRWDYDTIANEIKVLWSFSK
ncbi:MAG: C39 family peptidase [Eubacterium sp.]|nr:C39 family peptidase [Eubacterium sp.]